MYYISLLLVTVMILRGGGKCNCIVSIHLYSASCSAHQSEALPVRETQREESRLERTKRGTWLTSNKVDLFSLFSFPLLSKHSLVTQLLKKPSLDKEIFSNYRPVSNLFFISKLTERVVLSHISVYLTSNKLLNPHQSGFTKRHSTETLLTSLYNELVSAISHPQVSCLCLLDISAAFDTIDHNILLKRLSTWFGFTA